MNTDKRSVPIYLIIISAILLFLIVFVNVAAGTFGRYITSFDGEISFSFNSKSGAEITCGSWEVGTERQSLPIEITNNGAEYASVRVRAYIPDGAGEPPTVALLKWGETEYTAVISAIPEDTAAYREYGAGYICCFYGSDGSELAFETAQELSATLILVGGEIDTSGVKLVVDPLNHRGNGGNEQ